MSEATAIMAIIMKSTTTRPVEVMNEFPLWEDHPKSTLAVIYGAYSSMN